MIGSLLHVVVVVEVAGVELGQAKAVVHYETQQQLHFRESFASPLFHQAPNRLNIWACLRHKVVRPSRREISVLNASSASSLEISPLDASVKVQPQFEWRPLEHV